MDISFDASQITKLAADLSRSGQSLPQKVRPVVQKGALNVKTAMNEDFAESTSFKGLSGSVNYESKDGATFAEAEIGPDKGRYPGIPGPGKTRPAAPMANIAYFGGSYGGGGTVRDPQEALDDEAPKFEKALLALFEDIL